MEPEPTQEQRIAYRNWLLADEAAMNATDAVLHLIQSGQALGDLGELERLSARANELRAAADRTLLKALAALRPPAGDMDDAARWSIGEETASRIVAMIRAIVEIEVHQIRRPQSASQPAPANLQI